jgi:hypothetical protein
VTGDLAFPADADADHLFLAPRQHVVSALGVRRRLAGSPGPAAHRGRRSVTRGDLVLPPMLAWHAHARLSRSGGMTIWSGEGRGIGGVYDPTDAVFVRARLAF